MKELTPNSASAKWFETHRVKLAIALLVVIALSGFGAVRLEVTSSYASALGASNPRLLQFEQMERNYSSVDTVAIAIAPADGDIYQAAFLDAVFALTEESWNLPYVQRVDSITNYQHTYAQGDELNVVPLYDPTWEGGTPLPMELLREVAENERTLQNFFVAEDGSATIVSVTLDLGDGDRNDKVMAATNAILELTSRLATQHPGIDLHYAGKVFQDKTQTEASKADGRVQFPLLFLTLILVLWFFLRDWRMVLAAGVTSGLSLLPAAGLIGWLGMDWTVEGNAALSMVVPLAVADSVHLLTNYAQYSKNRAPITAMSASLHLNYTPILVTTVTTAIGFLSLNLVDAPPLRLIGNTVAIGVVFAFFITVIITPFLADFTQGPIASIEREERSMHKLAGYITNRAPLMATLFSLLSIGLVSGLWLNTLDQKTSEYYDASIDYRVDSDWIEARLGGAESINFVLQTKSQAGINDTAYLAYLDEFSSWLRDQPQVVNAAGFVDVVKRLNRVMNGDQEAFYAVPDTEVLASQYIWFYEQSLPFGLNLTDQVNFERDATRIQVSLGALSNQEIINFEHAALEFLQNTAPKDFSFYAASPSLMFAHQAMDNMGGLVKAWSTTFLFVSVVLIWTLRSLRLGLLSLLPNLLPAAIAFGLWGYLDGEIGLLTIIALGITLGIVVDDTVHFFVKFKYAQSKHSGSDQVIQSVRYAITKVGLPCLITAVALALGFSVLTTSSFVPHADMGAMSALTVSVAWVVDFVLLPAILILTAKFWRQTNNDSERPHATNA